MCLVVRNTTPPSFFLRVIRDIALMQSTNLLPVSRISFAPPSALDQRCDLSAQITTIHQPPAF